MDNIDISGLDKAEVFAALYNRAKTQGMGLLRFDPTPMTVEQARAVVEGDGAAAGGDYSDFSYSRKPKLSFDYFKGRVMKVDLSGDSFSAQGYDRDNGDGAALGAIQCLIDQRDAAKAAA